MYPPKEKKDGNLNQPATISKVLEYNVQTSVKNNDNLFTSFRSCG